MINFHMLYDFILHIGTGLSSSDIYTEKEDKTLQHSKPYLQRQNAGYIWWKATSALYEDNQGLPLNLMWIEGESLKVWSVRKFIHHFDMPSLGGEGMISRLSWKDIFHFPSLPQVHNCSCVRQGIPSVSAFIPLTPWIFTRCEITKKILFNFNF